MTEQWLQAIQTEGHKRWSELGIPTRRDEAWRYTSLKPLSEMRFKPATDVNVPVPALFTKPHSSRGCEIVFFNGKFTPSLSDLSQLPKGLRVGSLAESLKLEQVQRPDAVLLQQLLDFYPASREEAFTAYNRAQLGQGCFIVVDENVRVESPLSLIYLSSADGDGCMAVAPRTVVALAAGAQLQLLESYQGLGDQPYFQNAVTDIHLAQRADLKLMKVQAEGEQAFHIGQHRIFQSQASQFQSFNLSLGGRLSRHNLEVQVKGEQCLTQLMGLYLVKAEQHVDHNTRIEHLAPNSRSRQHYKGILDDQGHAVFKGNIHIRPEAQGTDSSQLNHNLLLSPRAEVDTLPQLEIFADDVKATHGATVGRLNEEEIFYIQSRGISAATARQMVMRGFVEDVLASLESREFSQCAHMWVEQSLHSMITKVTL